MSTFVYMTRCDGCGHCVDICPSDIMHIDENIRRAKNIEPNFCWECYSCVAGTVRKNKRMNKTKALSYFRNNLKETKEHNMIVDMGGWYISRSSMCFL